MVSRMNHPTSLARPRQCEGPTVSGRSATVKTLMDMSVDRVVTDLRGTQDEEAGDGDCHHDQAHDKGTGMVRTSSMAQSLAARHRN